MKPIHDKIPVIDRWVDDEKARNLGKQLERAISAETGFRIWYYALFHVKQKALQAGRIAPTQNEPMSVEDTALRSAYWSGYQMGAERVWDDLHQLIDKLKAGQYPIFKEESDAEGHEAVQDQGQ